MKRKALIKLLISNGCRLLRHGSNHDIYFNPANNQKSPVPRHNEIKESLIKLIKKQLGIL
ncbi:type II toxin-antitoxin system HicA family toxin [Bacteroidota bacterium]